MAFQETYMRWRYGLVPDRAVGEILSKNWIDNAIPVMVLGLVIGLFGSIVKDFLSLSSLAVVIRQLGEYLFVAFGMIIVLKAGGIDLSVGSIFALCNFLALSLVNVAGMPIVVVVPAVLAAGGLIGLVNGILVGYLRLRAFLTTLVTLIIGRAVVDLLIVKYATIVAASPVPTPNWDYIGEASILGVPFDFIIAAVIGVATHILLTRMRFGWHVSAVGGSRRSAYNVGLSVRRVVCLTYVCSGMFTAAGAIFYAARASSTGGTVGLGLEIVILTAAVLGGNSLGGGRGSVVKALLGTLIVVLITNGLIRLGLRSGATDMVLGLVLLAAVAIDVKWMKNRLKILRRTYVSPTYFALQPSPETAVGSGSPYEGIDVLGDATGIGVGQLDGPEDVILDEDDNLYCGSRHGDVMRFFGPDHKRLEVYAHIGGHPLGMAFNRERELVVCVGGMGLYKITRDREVVKLTDETNRSLTSIIDDSRMRIADDVDIAPDGRIFFSEATIRYDTEDWPLDSLEGRGNGRFIVYDPSTRKTRTIIPNLKFANGICMAYDGESFLFAETYGYRIRRYWFAGPKTGKIVDVIPNLPAVPDNINRASDGNYWVGLVGMRTPTFDLALRMPQFRRRMVNRVARDEWMVPNFNRACLIKIDVHGNILGCFWDRAGQKHPSLTSMREHKGYLYLGSLFHSRIGKWKIPGADPNWTSIKSYWGDRP